MKSVYVKSNKKTIAMLNGDGYAQNAVKGFSKENRVTGLTNGKFSLISLIRSLLDHTGPANIIISTWSAGMYDATVMKNLLASEKLLSIKMILDRSFQTRQKQYSTYITDLFSIDNIRTTDTHSKFVLIWNNEWNVCIRSSMNLNENKRCENFDVDNDIDIFNLFKTFSDELFRLAPPGIIQDRSIVDPIFNKLFDDKEFIENHPDENEIKTEEINYSIFSFD